MYWMWPSLIISLFAESMLKRSTSSADDLKVTDVVLIDAFISYIKIAPRSFWCRFYASSSLAKRLCAVGLFWTFTPTFLLNMKCDSKHNIPHSNAPTAYRYRKPTTSHQTILMLTSYGEKTRVFLFCSRGSESTVWMPFVPHVSSLCCWL